MKKGIDHYSIMIASKYFEGIEDFINLEMAVKRFRGNMERFHFNPIPLGEFAKKFFPNLETLHLYDKTDQKIKSKKIFKQCIWYYVDYERYLKEEEKGNDCKYWKNNIDHKGILERKNIINLDEMKQIEEWSEMKMGYILFDSNEDDWNRNTSVFHQRIINKSHLIFIIEDEDSNKFGGCVNTVIDKYEDFINDQKAFVFSLKSNGRLNGMFKFNIEIPQEAFNLDRESHGYLFAIGNGDIRIWKENNKNSSYCSQLSFNYNGIENAFCGKQHPERFTPKRITVIQLL